MSIMQRLNITQLVNSTGNKIRHRWYRSGLLLFNMKHRSHSPGLYHLYRCAHTQHFLFTFIKLINTGRNKTKLHL